MIKLGLFQENRVSLTLENLFIITILAKLRKKAHEYFDNIEKGFDIQ